MTIAANMPAYNIWSGNSSSVNFDFDFIIDKPSDLIVIKWNTLTNIRKTLVFEKDYLINDFSNQSGSYIVYPVNSYSEKLSVNEKIILISNREIKQQYPFTSSDHFDMNTFEKALDYIVTLIKQMSYNVGRAIKIPEGSENKYADEFLKEFLENIARAESTVEKIEQYDDEIEDIKQKIDDVSGLINFGVAWQTIKKANWVLQTNRVYKLTINDKSVVLGIYKTNGVNREKVVNCDITTTDTSVVITSLEAFDGYLLLASNTIGNYIYEQVEPADEWIVEHNLGKYPSVTTVDTTGYMIIGQVQYVDLNTVKINFTTATNGKAFLN